MSQQSRVTWPIFPMHVSCIYLTFFTRQVQWLLMITKVMLAQHLLFLQMMRLHSHMPKLHTRVPKWRHQKTRSGEPQPPQGPLCLEMCSQLKFWRQKETSRPREIRNAAMVKRAKSKSREVPWKDARQRRKRSQKQSRSNRPPRMEPRWPRPRNKHLRR